MNIPHYERKYWKCELCGDELNALMEDTLDTLIRLHKVQHDLRKRGGSSYGFTPEDISWLKEIKVCL